ncbi:hypothetical protein [Rhodococcus sp. WB9]|nr:hypothetical protein [Rhodococcus sp. WB9]
MSTRRRVVLGDQCVMAGGIGHQRLGDPIAELRCQRATKFHIEGFR